MILRGHRKGELFKKSSSLNRQPLLGGGTWYIFNFDWNTFTFLDTWIIVLNLFFNIEPLLGGGTWYLLIEILLLAWIPG